jgi:sigma-B regulation protein RsbQ
MSVLKRNNVHVVGQGSRTLVLGHGFGCDQAMWSALVPAFEASYRMVLFDYVGCGRSDHAEFDAQRYGSLQGHMQDVLDIAQALDLRDAVFVGHSVSATIGMLAAQREPQRFSHLAMIGPSPRYINDPAGGYFGGFDLGDVEGLLELMDSNYSAWAGTLAQAVAGLHGSAALKNDLQERFCAMHPDAARLFAHVTFHADNRADLEAVRQPTLILQCRDDVIAPDAVGEYVHRHIPGSTLVRLQATGHCPHVSHPEETIAALRGWLHQHALPDAV